MNTATITRFILTASLCCLMAAPAAQATRTKSTGGTRGGSPAQPNGTGPGGSYGGPGDTVAGGGSGGAGGTFGGNCNATACPVTFSDQGCDVECDYELVQDGTQQVMASCLTVSTVYNARSFSFTYLDWRMMRAMVTPDSDGNVTICTPLVGNIQEVYVLESQRINGRPTGEACDPTFPAVKAEVWIEDGHAPLPEPDCGRELLTRSTFSFITHCGVECGTAKVYITFNADCMDQAVDWWRTNYGVNCYPESSSNQYALQCGSWLFNVGMLTCNPASGGEH